MLIKKIYTILLVMPSLVLANSANLDVTDSRTAAEASLSNKKQVNEESQSSVLELKSKFTISDGNRIELNSKGFSIKPPSGWEVHLNFPNVSLLMQKPYSAGDPYQRTIQVMKWQGGMPIDKITASDFENTIVTKFSKALPTIEEYKMRNNQMAELEDQTPAILYYSEFTIGDQNIMQAHILTSSADNHYLVTYTDIASHFEGDAASKYLTEAWNSMVSLQLESSPPIRLRAPVLIGLGAGFLLALGLLFIVFRKYKAGKEYGDLIEASDSMSNIESTMQSTTNSQISEISATNTQTPANKSTTAAIKKTTEKKTITSALVKLEQIELKDEEEGNTDQWNFNNSDSNETSDDLSDFDEIEKKAS